MSALNKQNRSKGNSVIQPGWIRQCWALLCVSYLGREHPGFTGPDCNDFPRSMESLPSPFQVKSSHFIMSSLFLPYSNSFSYKKTDLFGCRGYMLLFLSLVFKEKRKVSGEKGWGYRESFLRGDWEGWGGSEHKEEIHFPLRQVGKKQARWECRWVCGAVLERVILHNDSCLTWRQNYLQIMEGWATAWVAKFGKSHCISVPEIWQQINGTKTDETL